MELSNQKNICLSEEDRKELIALGTGTPASYDDTQTFVSMFAKQAQQCPYAEAVADGDGRLSYSELDRKSNAAARLLRARGISKNDFVCVCLPRVKEFVIAVIGIWKAGAAYIPVDPEYPEERIRYMMEDSGAKLVIEEDFFTQNDLECQSREINLASPDQLAYMIYTSGSTGKPKGVMVRHSALTAYINATCMRYGLTSDDRAAEFVSFSFDASLPGLFPPLVCGGSVHILGTELRSDLVGMACYLNENRITYIAMPTSIGIELLRGNKLGLRFIQLGGEKLNYIPETDVQIYNEYGPTEFSVCATAFAVEQGVHYDNIPIGRPVPNSIAAVIDEEGNLLPRGEIGELALLGAQISDGYWNRPDQTVEKFVDAPFMPGKKMYKTGDLVRWSDDGNLIFEGRMDHQIKFHGFRIEKGEIESKMQRIHGVRLAVVEVQTINKIQHLVGYYTAETGKDPGSDTIMAALSAELADYMVPRLYIHMDKMPLTPNGKISRNELPIPEVRPSECVPPETHLEELLLTVCRDVLKLQDFGVTDDLFDFGLYSLAAIMIAAAMAEKKVLIKAEDILRLKTVRAIAANKKSLGSWFGRYDPEKPVLVLVSGLIPYSMTVPLLAKCAEAYNCFCFEPLQGHYDYIFDGADVNETAALYNAYFDACCFEGVKVSVMMGFCFAGEIAANMASLYAGRHGVKPTLVLLDTKFIDGSDYVSDEEIEQLLTDRDEILFQKNMNRIGEALTKNRVIHAYDGPTLEFLATVAEPVLPGQLVSDELYASQNEAARNVLKQYFSDLQIVEMKTGHFSILDHFSDVCFPYMEAFRL